MKIGPAAPFELSEAPDGTKHGVKGNIQVSVLPDVGEIEMCHRLGRKPFTGEQQRWLACRAGDVRIYVHGTHVVVTKQDLLPNFGYDNDRQIINAGMRHLKAHKDENSRYVVDTDQNRSVLEEMISLARAHEREKIAAELSHDTACLLSGEDK